jgi:hypothetical protein
MICRLRFVLNEPVTMIFCLEYYMAFIDSFQIESRDYVVMYNYEPDDGSHQDPEIAIMRAERSSAGEQYFRSIKNHQELSTAFDVFFARFEEQGGL